MINGWDFKTKLIIIWINLILCLILFFFDFNLVVLHIWLMSKKLSTYDYIL